MTEYQYYRNGKSLLLRIVRRRRWLINHQLSQLPRDFTTRELKRIDYAIGRITNGNQMKEYLTTKSDSLTILISAVNHKFKNELEILTKINLNNL